jgi:hypothetical protein
MRTVSFDYPLYMLSDSPPMPCDRAADSLKAGHDSTCHFRAIGAQHLGRPHSPARYETPASTEMSSFTTQSKPHVNNIRGYPPPAFSQCPCQLCQLGNLHSDVTSLSVPYPTIRMRGSSRHIGLAGSRAARVLRESDVWLEIVGVQPIDNRQYPSSHACNHRE